MFDNKPTNKNSTTDLNDLLNKKDDLTSIGSDDLQKTNTAQNFKSVDELNQGKDFPFKKKETESRLIENKQAEDIFSQVEKNDREAMVERPMTAGGGNVIEEQKQSLPQDDQPKAKFDFKQDNLKTEPMNQKTEANIYDMPKNSGLPKKILKIVLVVLVIFVFLGSGWWAYSRFFKQPVETLDNMILEEENGLRNILKDLSDDLMVDEEKETSEILKDEEMVLQEEVVEDESVIDSDGDGLSDEQELFFGTNPSRVDTDFDGLSDFDEVENYGTDPTNADSDGDGYLDGIELLNGYDPLGPGKLIVDN